MPAPDGHTEPCPPDGRTNAELAQLLRAGREESIRWVLRCFGSRVFHQLRREFFWRLNDDDLEDVLSIALFRLWASRATYDPERCSLGTWLYVIAKKVAFDIVRQKRRMSFQSLKEDSELAIIAQPLDNQPVSAHTKEKERILLLRSALASLSETDRQILFTLVGSERGESWTQPLTQELGMTANALRVRRSRIIERLRKRLSLDLNPT